jgi:hypothetical protein
MVRGNIAFNTHMLLYLDLLLRRLQHDPMLLLLVLDKLDFVLLERADSCGSYRGPSSSPNGSLSSYNHSVIVVTCTDA